MRPRAYAGPLAVLALFAAAGCETKLEGPTPSLMAVTPRLLVAGQPAVVVVNGGGLSALPLGSLTGAVMLAVPKVTLRRVIDLAGEATTDEPINIDDSAGSTRIRLMSDASMALDLPAEMGLMPGVYSIDVLTPHASRTTLEKAFVIIPGPTITSVSPTKACSQGMSQNVTVKGKDFLVWDEKQPKVALRAEGSPQIAYPAHASQQTHDLAVLMPGLNALLFSELLFAIEKGSAMPASYDLVVTHPEPLQGISATAEFEVLGPPMITNVQNATNEPGTLCPKGNVLSIQGNGFEMGAVASINGTPAKTTMVMSATHIVADFTNGTYTPAQNYTVVVTNMPDMCKAMYSNQVAGVEGPNVLFVDPRRVTNAVAAPIQIMTSTIKGVPGMMSIKLQGAMMGRPLMGALDPGHVKRVLATLPKGLMPGVYDLTIPDDSRCASTVVGAFTVTDAMGPTVQAVTVHDRAAGRPQLPQEVTIRGTGFVALPRVYLAAAAATVEVTSVVFGDGTSLTATLPGLEAGSYDVAVVNPDGSAGVLPMGYTVSAATPPRIDSVVPSVVPAGNMAPVLVNGAGFSGAMSRVTLHCSDMNLINANVQAFKMDGTQLTLAAPPLVTPGITCVVRATNADGAFADFASIAVSGPNGAAVGAKPGPELQAARRGAAVGLVAPAGGVHYLVAAGGDLGLNMGVPIQPSDTVETLRVDGSGPRGTFALQTGKLRGPTTTAALATLGRYVYVVGGSDGAAALKSVSRALLLDPARAPAISNLVVEQAAGVGLMPGSYSYRVSAVADPADADNPGGESIGSVSYVARVPTFMAQAQVTITWTKVPGALGYRVYRSPMADGGAPRLVMAVGDVATFTDMGAAPMPDAAPLDAGSLGQWAQLPDLDVARQSPAVVLAADPAKAGQWNLYAVGGADAKGDPIGSYELMPITVAMDGVQTADKWKPGAKSLARPRSQAGAWLATVGGSSVVYVGGGLGVGVNEPSVEVGTIAPGGDLGDFVAVGGATVTAFGFAAVVAGNQLFTVGNDVPDKNLAMTTLPMLAPDLGPFTAGGTMTSARYLCGAAVDGPILFAIGGSSMGKGSATRTTEWMVY